MDTLTERQADILGFVRCQIEGGLPPTLAEIAEAFDFNQPAAALKHLRALEAKGYLKLLPSVNRGIRLLAPGRALEGLPVIGRVAAGHPILAEAHVERHVALAASLFHPRAHYLLHVRGDSMREAGILDGDLAAIHRTSDVRSGQIVVARLDDEVTLKRLKRNRVGIELLPENPDYDPIPVDPKRQAFAIEGLYVGVLRLG